MTQRHIDQLLDTLDAERAALQSANYDVLDDLHHRMAGLLEQIAQQGHPPDTLKMIKAKVQSNQSLLRAAISGVAAARDRVMTLHQVQSGLSVYDQTGQLATVPTRHGGLEKKA